MHTFPSAHPATAKQARPSICLRVLAAWTLVACAIGTSLRADDFVVVSAAAISQYDRTGDGKTAPRMETYAVSPGRYFANDTRDASATKVTFEDVVAKLQPALAEQNYHPAKDPDKADLLIIVHWGTTRAYEDPNREQNLENLNKAIADMPAGSTGADASAVNFELGLQANEASVKQRYMSEAADILGYKRSIREKQTRIIPSAEERTMLEELAEERYFVVLMAYDYGIFKNEKRRHLLWATHMNVRSAGNNFVAAVPQMMKVAAKYFGRDQAELVHVETRLRDGKVDIGELQVVSSEGSTTKPAPAR